MFSVEIAEKIFCSLGRANIALRFIISAAALFCLDTVQTEDQDNADRSYFFPPDIFFFLFYKYRFPKSPLPLLQAYQQL
jgi:hypothetical protein